LAILVRHGVPTRLGGSGVSIPRSGGAGIPVTSWAGGVGAALIAVAALLVARRRAAGG
jgi:LPXTG-motif cell wall-anchored protein